MLKLIESLNCMVDLYSKKKAKGTTKTVVNVAYSCML